MKAMILAAGLGTRMRPLTNDLPKPLLPVAGSTLIEMHLYKLAQAGVQEVIINVSYLGEKIEQALGDGRRYSLKIVYSREPEPLETAGGIQNALPLLGEDCFLLVNADIWIDVSYENLVRRSLNQGELAHLVLVDNPAHHPEGDFSISGDGALMEKQPPAFTFSGLSLLDPSAFQEGLPSNKLVDLFTVLIREQSRIDQALITAEYFPGAWFDVGTPERLQSLERFLL